MIDSLPVFEWKPVVYRGKTTDYMVSNYADIYNLRTKSLLKKFACSSGNYQAVHLFIDGKDYKVMVHRLVATAFIPNPENKPEVNHKDTITFHNFSNNLEWVTHKENIEYMIKMGNQIVGTKHKNCIHTEDQIRYACELLQDDELELYEIKKITGVSTKTLSRIRDGSGWRHISRDYFIDPRKHSQGPKMSPISRFIYKLVLEGKSNKEIYDAVEKSGLAESVTRKSMCDKILHCKKIINSV